VQSHGFGAAEKGGGTAQLSRRWNRWAGLWEAAGDREAGWGMEVERGRVMRRVMRLIGEGSMVGEYGELPRLAIVTGKGLLVRRVLIDATGLVRVQGSFSVEEEQHCRCFNGGIYIYLPPSIRLPDREPALILRLTSCVPRDAPGTGGYICHESLLGLSLKVYRDRAYHHAGYIVLRNF
jgi:hypothetical protein